MSQTEQKIDVVFFDVPGHGALVFTKEQVETARYKGWPCTTAIMLNLGYTDEDIASVREGQLTQAQLDEISV